MDSPAAALHRRRPPRRARRLAARHARHGRVRARAGVGRRELPPLLPRRRPRRARARAGADADRDGRAAADGELPALRRTSRALLARRRRPRAARARAGPRARLPAARPTSAHAPTSPRSTRRRAHGLYLDAIDALVRLQRAIARRRAAAVRRGAAAPRARALSRLVRRAATSGARSTRRAARGARRACSARILANNLAQPRVFVHRDYHSRNLMVSEPNPGVLDFQDAVYGPDHLRPRVAAARRLRRAGTRSAQIDWAVRYWERARAGRPAGGRRLRRVLARLRVDGRAAPAQGARHLRAPLPPRRQARLRRRHAARDARTCAARARATATLAPLLALLDALEDRAPAVGYAF